MDDADFIRETMRAIGVCSISAAQEAAIMAAPELWRDVYSHVFIACRNIKNGVRNQRSAA